MRPLSGIVSAGPASEVQWLGLEHLHRVRFTYPEGWAVLLDGGRQQRLYLAEGSPRGHAPRTVPRRRLPVTELVREPIAE